MRSPMLVNQLIHKTLTICVSWFGRGLEPLASNYRLPRAF